MDAQTNAYANVGGTVILLNGDGVPFQTNSICPRPGLARRDADGNFYFAGVLPSHIGPSLIYLEFEPQDFGGITLSNLPVYVAKYSPLGTLLWATNFGPANSLRGITVTDLVLDVEGNILMGYLHFTSTQDHSPVAAKLTEAGHYLWSTLLPKYGSWSTTTGTVRLTPTSSALYALTYIGAGGQRATLSRIDVAGTATVITNWPTPYEVGEAPHTIINSFDELYDMEELPNSGMRFTKRQTSGSVIWRFYTGNFAQRVVGPDWFDGVHAATDTGQLSRYDYDGNLAWTVNLPSNCEDLILDGQGNRFLSLSGGAVGRLGSEPLHVPVITNAPFAQTILAGSNADFAVGASGTTPLQYCWRFASTNIPNATNSVLTLTNVAVSQAGDYQVVVSNHVGSLTSSPALLRIKNIAVFVGNQLLANGTYSFQNPPTLTIRSAFVNGSEFYTLNGFTPSFASTFYSGPFIVSQSATVRAIGYSANFLQSEEADAVTVTVSVTHALSASASAGGSVRLNPPGGVYPSTDVVLATAVPSNGWTFLYWLGDATGPNPSANISMARDRTIRAVFGTTLSATVAGNGSIQLFPPGGLYPYGTTVRLIAYPEPGNYFGFWGNAATGNTNPLYFTISAPTQTVSSIFGSLPADWAALTVLINGRGRVNANPRDNVYPTNQTVTLIALPEAGQSFLNWSGDASGTQNPLLLPMTQSKLIMANFTDRPGLHADRPGWEGFSSEGFRLTLASDPPSTWQILASTNLSAWEVLGSVTNQYGEVQFTDTNAVNFPLRFYKASPW